MMEKVAIVGIGQTKFEREKKEQAFAELAYEVVTKALKDAGMTIAEIDNVVTISNDFWDGRTISSMAVMDACGAYDKDVTTVEGDGTFGALLGYMRTLSGSFGTTLVVAHSKISEGNPRAIFNCAFDPIYERMLGLDAITSSALQARRYMVKYGVTEEQFAKVSVKNHKNAKKNPYAQLPLDIKVEDVLTSRMLADPIKLLDASPISDGACAIILANERKAKKISEKPVWIKGVGHCADAYHLGDRDLAETDSLREAANKAYKMAGVKNPIRDIDVAEVYDAFSYQELMWLEGLGLCKKGEGGKLIDEGVTEMSGELPVNPSGGVLSAHAVLVAGLVRIAEAALQIRGDAGKRQLPNVNMALAHGVDGSCGQSHCVWVLGM
jgi:acetyl-CoA C-acetyltransferase